MLTRRELLRRAGMIGGVAATSLDWQKVLFADGGSGGTSGEPLPTSPLILAPFTDDLPIPQPYKACDPRNWSIPPDPSYHQIWPCAANGMRDPIYYNIPLLVRPHSFTSSKVQPIDSNGSPVLPPDRIAGPRSLPDTTIYGFNGTFPGPMIYASYGQPVCVRFENHLDENPYGLDRGSFGAPDLAFLTHLHNGHTAPESDGNPHFRPQAYRPGEYCDNVYLNWPAGGDDCEKQSFFWFHDHRMDHTGANVYKGMVGLFPIYDPKSDPGDERNQPAFGGTGLGLPGVPNAMTGRIDYDIPLAFYDCRIDDGITPHQDFHNPGLGAQPKNWGKTFFAHYPDQGFVGDVFTVNGKAYPVLHVKRRKYRLRFLDASISRCYELKLMSGKVAAAPGQLGQFQLSGQQQVMKFTQIAAEGGLLPEPLVKDSITIWPAKRREAVVDFTRYMDGSPTKKGDVIYLTDVMAMSSGRKPDSPDPKYNVPVLKIIIDDLPAGETDYSVIPAKLRDCPSVPPLSELSKLTHHRVELQRGGGFGGEIQWLISIDGGPGLPFDNMFSAINVPQGDAQIWTIANGGGGWVHPLHLHMEEHQVLSRNGVPTSTNSDDHSKEDVIALGPSEEVMIYRKFRTFKGKYVAHCHNLAHEDHAMMFGWTIV